MSISNVTKTAVKTAIKEALNLFRTEDDFEVITDLHLHLSMETGELSITDDNESTLSNTTIGEWIDKDGEQELADIAQDLTNLLQQMSANKDFANLNIAKPFSFVLEDEDKETIEELYIVDDDTIFLSNDLLKQMDKDLDDFLEKLMSE